MNTLFSSIRLGKNAILKNRLCVAPMTTSQSQEDGQVSTAESAWLERLASDDYGMIITCAASISRTAIAFHRQMSIADDIYVPGLTSLATRLKKYSTLSIIQLCHGGSRAIPGLTRVEPHSASDYDLPGVPGFIRPRAFTIDQIHGVINDFASAAERVARAGFGGIEFHGANGYLFTQFTSTMTNRRQDSYGGTLENRARFSREVVRACRTRVPAEFVLGYRMSFEGFPPETGLDIDENIQIMNWLEEDGIDYGHISHMALASRSLKYPEKIALRYIREGVHKKLPLIAAGGVFSRFDAEHALELGADIVAIGRAAIGNALIPEHFNRGEQLHATPFDKGRLGTLAVSKELIDYIAHSPLARMNIIKE